MNASLSTGTLSYATSRRPIQPLSFPKGPMPQQRGGEQSAEKQKQLLSTREMEDEERSDLVPNNISSTVFSHSPIPHRTPTEPGESSEQRTPQLSSLKQQPRQTRVRQSSTRIIDVRQLKKSIISRNVQQLTAKRDVSNSKLMDVGSLIASNKELHKRSQGKQPGFDMNRSSGFDITKQPTAETVDERRHTPPKRLHTQQPGAHNHSKCCTSCGDPPVHPKKVAMPKRLPNIRCLAIQKRPILIVTPTQFNQRLERELSASRNSMQFKSKQQDLTRTQPH